MQQKTIIFWFRRDLRLDDNRALNAALASNYQILPVFIYDTEILADLKIDDARVTFIHKLLTDINSKFQNINRTLATFTGQPEEVLSRISVENDVVAVFANHDYEPYAIARDAKIKTFLQEKNIEFNTYKDQVIFERDDVVKDDGKPYVVFTPYANKWKSLVSADAFKTQKPTIDDTHFKSHNYPFLRLEDFGFIRSQIEPAPIDLSAATLADYASNRDVPSKKATTNLSPHLRFGAISIREVFAIASAHSNKKLVDELIWREFFMQILWHFPRTVTHGFKPQYDYVEFRNNEREFDLWKQGKTGYPIVDAGMRELNKTGLMHNRVRMIVAGFLCKHLLIDWRWGEAYFAEKLLDYEQASNIGNWQWAAGSGVDAAPYFRIFNPTEQVKKFDRDLAYINKWVPELNSLSYPQPIVEHKFARERCLETYKVALTKI